MIKGVNIHLEREINIYKEHACFMSMVGKYWEIYIVSLGFVDFQKFFK